jgi:hypothetical protein
VGGQVVHDDDIAGPQGRDRNLFDIGEDGSTAHGAIQSRGRGDVGQPEATNEGCRFLMTCGTGAPRYDKLAPNFLSAVALVAIIAFWV